MRFKRITAAAVFAAAAACAAAADERAAEIVGHTECAECHEKSALVWEKTHHAKSFTEVHRAKEGREIAKKMGVKRIKDAAGPCAGCHFTARAGDDNEVKVIAGISCESCHSPAKNWLKVHSEFSGKEEQDETPEEEAKRWADSEAAGMIRPHAIARLAANCFGCHVVPNEELVNVGGHAAGSKFELVAWLMGEVRHRVWYSEANDLPEQSRLRLLYLVGALSELEASLRALSVATEKADYAKKMAKRSLRARKRLEKIAETLPLPELQAAIAAAMKAKLKLNNEAELAAAADAVAAQVSQIAAHDGGDWAALDALLPPADKYRGDVVP